MGIIKILFYRDKVNVAEEYLNHSSKLQRDVVFFLDKHLHSPHEILNHQPM